MALMKLAGVWERFILKDLTTVAKYAKVELTPPGPGDLVGAVKGVGGLTKDALTFKWAQASLALLNGSRNTNKLTFLSRPR